MDVWIFNWSTHDQADVVHVAAKSTIGWRKCNIFNLFLWESQFLRDHPFSMFVIFFQKTNISYPLIRTRTRLSGGKRCECFEKPYVRTK